MFIIYDARNAISHHFSFWMCFPSTLSRGQLKCDGTRAETRFRLSVKRTSPFTCKPAVGRQFSRLLAAEVCASAVVMVDTPCSEVVWRVMATHSIRQFPLHFPFLRHRVPSNFNCVLPSLLIVNGRDHLNWWGRHFSRLLAAEVCASAVVMLDTPCSEVMWRVMPTHSIRQFPPSLTLPCVTVCHHVSTGVYFPQYVCSAQIYCFL